MEWKVSHNTNKYRLKILWENKNENKVDWNL